MKSNITEKDSGDSRPASRASKARKELLSSGKDTRRIKSKRSTPGRMNYQNN